MLGRGSYTCNVVCNKESYKANSDDLKKNVYQNFKSSNASAADVYTDEELENYNNLKLAGLKEAPLHLAVFTELNPELGKGLGRQTMPETLVYSTVIAIHNLWLFILKLVSFSTSCFITPFFR